ncbi:unnamed protein product [Linum tenue]|uniref:Uncharacterized protein n=2 Tax=Linum tenue TaxID=586396 RepID=A0AAV0HPH1_9ROSI|nr:unnamed protein product [Linum tenue]
MSSSDIELIEAQGRIWSYSYSFIINKCLKCAIQLGIPDVIHRHSPGPTSLPALASALHLPPSKHDALRRLMRLLVHAAFFKLQEAEDHYYYSLTPASELLLLPDDRAEAEVLKAPPVHLFLLGIWRSLSAWFRRSDGAAPVEAVLGMSFWDAMAREPSLMQTFYGAMSGDSKLVARVLVSDCCKELFRGVGSLVDVGGGTGTMAAAIARAYPDINCTVFELPQVVPDSQDQEAIFLGGNMFQENIPHGDALLLKWVLHNWDDDNCVKILKKCREAVLPSHGSNAKSGKVILIDMVVGNNQPKGGDFSQVQLCSDLLMMCLLNGKERTETELNNLLMAAGFSGYKIVRAIGPRSIIEAYP